VDARERIIVNRQFGIVFSTLVLALSACDTSTGEGPGLGDGDGDTSDGPGQVEIAEDDMVDDFEDGEGTVPEVGGRIGSWYTYHDASSGGTMSPAQGSDFTPESCGPNGSAYCAHVSGSGFTDWGAGMGGDLNNDGSAKGTYDASGYEGLAFWAKGNGAVRVGFATSATVPEAGGGDCVPGAGDGEECENGHGKVYSLGSEWEQYLLPFDEAAQDETWGQQVAFDPSTIMSVEVGFDAGVDFDVYLDEIGFY
jgi:hypothetical protein